MNGTADNTIGPYSDLIYSRASFPDTDRDGIPDVWEMQYGLSPTDGTDATLDPDGDGVTNFQGYVNNGDPHLNLSHGINLPGTIATSGGGNATCFDQKTTTHDGVDAAQSGSIMDNQSPSSSYALPQARCDLGLD